MVFYRKYRFQNLDEMVGQESVKQALKSAILNDKLAHAYLFFGPRGTGKTSAARVLAKTVNCEKRNPETGNPCDKCASCLSIIDGTNLDVIEMDAASNRGIEDIRNLRDNIKLSPSASKMKVYIIDEVHMLSGDAFNALLKTLEEPPSHVLFILATTELQKIPATILSRVQRLEFKRASIDELVEALAKVALSEKIEVSKDVLRLIAKRAQGSFRDGIKLLDLFSSMGEINEKSIEASLGTGAFENNLSLLSDIAEKKSKEALLKLYAQIDLGINIKEVTLTLLDILRQMLLIQNGLGVELVQKEMEDKYDMLVKVAEKFEGEHLMKTIDNFTKSLDQARYASIPSLPLEVAIVTSCLESSVKSLESSKKEEIVDGRQEEKLNDQVSISKENIELAAEKLVDLKPLTTLPSSTLLPNQSADIKKILDKWTYILETVRAYNFSLEALLRNSKISECNEKSVVFEVPYSFHQRILEAPKSKDLLQSILADILGRSIAVSTILGQQPVRREELVNIEVAADDEIVRLAAEIFNSETAN